jgi:tetratricopeptide (TPR) repeat protein
MAEKDYRGGHIDEARCKLDDVLKKHPSAPDAGEAYYLRAQCNAQSGNKSQAQSDIERCLAISKNADLTARAHALMATLAFEAGDSQKAIEHYRQAFKNLPTRPPYDLARYRYGVCLAQEGQWKDAREQWSEVVKNYNGSEMIEQTQRMLSWPGDYFSIQCGAYRDTKTAVKQKDNLVRAGLNARVETRKRSGETLQVVYVGQYPRYDQAQAAVRAAQKNAPGAVIVPQ